MKLDVIIAKEQKELQKWRRELERPMGKGYMPLLIVIISLVYLLDALASDLHSGLQDLQYTFFANAQGTTYDEIASRFAFLGLAPILINMIAPFYKALADKYGRKIMFVMSTMGMGIGLLIGVFSTNVIVYWLGRILLTFFVIADIQIVYIMEISAPEKRARLFGVTKFISQLGILIIPACRDLFLNADGSNWQMVCLLPAIIAAACTILIMVFVRESVPFMEKRIAYLETPYEERLAREQRAKTDKSVSSNKSGIIPGIKYVFRNRYVRAIAFASFFVLFGYNAFVSYNTTIWIKSGMSLEQRTAALYFFPVAAAVVTLCGGFISDKWGRKASCCLFAAVSLIGLAGFFLTASPSLPPYITGLLYGLCYGAFWTTNDILGLMAAESVKTEIRSSAQSVFGLVSLVSIMLSTVAFGVIFDIAGNHFLTICLAWGLVTMGLALFLVITRTKETKGIDINRAGEDTV